MSRPVQDSRPDGRAGAYFGAPAWALALFAVAALPIVILGFRFTAPILLATSVIALVAARTMPSPPRTGHVIAVLGPLAIWTAIAAHGLGDGAFSARANTAGIIVFVVLSLLAQVARPGRPAQDPAA